MLDKHKIKGFIFPGTSGRILFHFLIAFSLEIPSTLQIDVSPQEQGKIIPGIHKEYLPQPIFYESYIPIVYEYQTPRWNKTDITFNNWYTCVSEHAPYRYSCPVAFHMNQAVANLHVDFNGLLPISDTNEPKENDFLDQSYFESLTSSSEFCNKIQPHFSGIWTFSKDVERYLNILNNCHWSSDETVSKLQPIVERSISQYNYSVRLPFTRMENNFYNTFYKHIIAGDTNAGGGSGSGGETNISSRTGTMSPMIASALTPQPPNLDLVASALLSNARTTLQAGILGVYYAEKNRWIHANQDCLNQVIPQSIVTSSKFNSSLDKIQKTLLKNYALSSSRYNNFEIDFDVSIGSESISKYYSLPLTDCSHASSNNFVVRILVPILKKDRSKTLQLIHVHNIPFQVKDHICRLKLNPNENHSNSHLGLDDLYNGGGGNGVNGFFQQLHGSHNYLYEEIASLAFPTDCKGNQLCKISEYALNPKNSDQCVSALLSRNHQGIQHNCHFHCSKQDLGGGGSDNNSNNNKNTPIITRIHSNAYILTGSPVQFRIKCKAQPMDQIVNVDAEQVGSLWIDLPCNCQMIVDNKNVFYGEGPCLNTTEFKVYPIIPFQFARSKPKSGHDSLNQEKQSNFYYESLDEGTFVNLADYIDSDKVEGYLKNAAERKQKAEASRLVGGTDGNESSSSVGSLWVVFIITVIILFSVQIYILYLIKRDQKVSYPKDDRILYKVPDSPPVSLNSLRIYE